MATTTGYLGLTKPAYTEAADIAVINGNMDKIDQAVVKNVPMPNLLTNWYFVGGGTPGNFPVNQRGKTSYGSNEDAIDRWKMNYNTTMAIASDGISVEGPWDVTQLLPNVLPYGTYTLSALILSNAAPMYISAANAGGESICHQYTSASASPRIVSVTVTSGSIKQISISNSGNTSGSAKIAAIKLESGDKQTLAHQDENGNWVLNEIPDYAQELQKCRVYYQMPVYNLLDNSDFRNPVNQRGKTSATGYTYLFDRWKAAENAVSANMSSSGITTDSYLIQQIPLNRFTYGKAYTAALYYADGSVVAKSGIATQATTGWTNWISTTGLLVYVGSTAQTNLSFRISAHPDKTIMAAALYEGAYTAETLPAYVPKGYAAELAECQRYYVAYTGKYICAAGVGDNNGCVDVSFPLPVKMRIIPTVRFGVWSDGVYTQNDTVNVSVNGTRSYMAATQYYNTESVVAVRLVNAALINAPCSVFFSFTASADL